MTMVGDLCDPCPKCGKKVEGSAIGWIKKRTRFPAHCGYCGTKLFPSCPNCKSRLVHLMTFCPHCGKQIYEQIKANDTVVIKEPLVLKSNVPNKAKQVLLKTRTDVNDMYIFWREAYRVFVWLNPIQVQVQQFSERLQQIDEKTTGEEKADIIDKSLGEINFESTKEIIDYEQSIWDFTKDNLFLWHDALEKNLPSYGVKWPKLPDITKKADCLRSSLLQALRSKNDDLVKIKSMLMKLKKDFPEFRSIVSKTGFWDSAIETGLWMTGHFWLAILKQATHNLTEKSDEEFTNSYANAIEEFIALSDQRSQSIAEGVDRIVLQAISEIQQLSYSSIQGLARISISGVDVESVTTKLRIYDAPRSDDEREFNELILTKLRDKHLVNLRAEQNLRSILGIG